MTFSPRPVFEWRLRSRSLTLGRRTCVMAILNLTPDSFSGDGFAGKGVSLAVEAACRRWDEGADILDMGAESTRPGAQPIGAGEEQERLLPVLEALLKERPGAIVSVDTYHAATAIAAAEAGAEIVNDVSGLTWDSGMAQAVAATQCGLVLMHTRGEPTGWRGMSPVGATTVVEHVLQGLRERMEHAVEAGIQRSAIVLDPGFAFGKFGKDNFALLAGLPALQQPGCPLLVGLSRKGFLGLAVKGVQTEEQQKEPPAVARRDATLAAQVAAVLAGAHVLRAHDLQATREAVAIADAVLDAAGLQPPSVSSRLP